MPAIAREPLVRHDLLDRLGSSRQQTDDLFAIVNSDALYERPIAERHRIIFYIGHLEAFDWNLLRERAFGLKSFHPEFDRLFAFGIDPVGGGLPSDQPADWPAISQVKQYVEKIRGALDEKLSDAFDDPPPLNGGFPLPILLNVAIEHRLMHAETLAYMLHQLPLNRKQHRAEPREVNVPPISHRSVEIPSGRVTLGLPRASEVFGWDNEYEEQAVDVPAFAIDRYMVTNRQFLEFIHAGGYETKLFWQKTITTRTGAGNRKLEFHIQLSGNLKATVGCTAPCSPRFLYRSTGRSTSARRKRRPTRVGQGSPCLLKPNGSERPTVRLVGSNSLILGASRRQTPGWETSTSRVGVL